MSNLPERLLRASPTATREALAHECSRSPSFQEWFVRVNAEADRLRPKTKREARAWEQGLAVRIKAGDRLAREELITANIPLAYGAAAAHLYSGAPLQDLISAALIGLCEAAASYKSKRARFTTWASPKMLSAIQRQAVMWESSVRVPVHVLDATPAIRRAARAIEDSGEVPTVERVAAATGHSKLIVCTVLSPPATISYDAPRRGENGDMEPDDAAEFVLQGAWDPDEATGRDAGEVAAERLEQAELRASYKVHLSYLPVLERRAVMLSYGLDNKRGRERTPEQVARIMGVTLNQAINARERGLIRLRRMVGAPYQPRKYPPRLGGKKPETPQAS